MLEFNNDICVNISIAVLLILLLVILMKPNTENFSSSTKCSRKLKHLRKYNKTLSHNLEDLKTKLYEANNNLAAFKEQSQKVSNDLVTCNNKLDREINVTGCEGGNAFFNCPNGSTIRDATIRYGRWDNNVCPHPTVNQWTSVNYKTYPLNQAVGNQQYNFGVTNSNIGEDPDPNIYKHWKATYKCT